ncbi:hypothetical protein Pfo_020769 [Paulownia fortunei]|nr:hypothetical protein Pfo_020769 [Paulownia fortunei]
MAYAAVISLKHTIESLLNSCHISIVLNSSPEILEFAYKEVQSLQQVLKRLDSSSSSRSERVNALDGQIREAACELEDVLESHVSNQFLSQSEESLGYDEGCSLIDLEEVRQEIKFFSETVKKIEEEYIEELSNPLPEEEDDAVPSRIDFGQNKSKMVGLSDEFPDIRTQLLFSGSLLIPRTTVVSLVGMAGIGKTTLAKEIFEDPLILSHFHCRAWVTVGPKYQLEEILQDILAQVNPNIDKIILTQGEERLANLKRMMSESLKGRRFLIVLDDVWKRIRVLLTTRLQEVASAAASLYCDYKLRFLNKEESWYLLREKVFGEESCPPQLEKAGKKIADNCEGLPLTIVTVAELLSKAEKTPEYWNKVAEKENSVFMDAVHDQMSKVLLPSYNYLPQHLKSCFLYLGVFPLNDETPLSKLIKLWSAEGFLEPYPSQPVEYSAVKCLEELVSKSLVIVLHKNSISSFSSSTYEIKTCSLHSVFWHLCNRQAEKNKFSYVINSYADGLAEGIKSQRRLCIHNNILFGIKDVYNSCTFSAMHWLLRVLDALTIRFYEFPIQVLKLVRLRYLSLTCNGKLPPSISKLRNLHFLIVCRHLSIKYSGAGAQSYLPVEIWCMQELKHLQIMGSELPDPCGAVLPNLQTLLDVSAHSCTKGVLERIPDLKKLGIQIELAPDAAEPLSCFDHICHLHGLESLKCVIVNPELRSEIVAPHVPLSIFPLGLKKLSLSGFRYPWEDLRVIASLPNLQAQSGKHMTGFLQLKFLLLEDTDLVQWRAGYGCFPLLQRLIIRHCYKLKGIPMQIGRETLKIIELVDVNPSAVASAKHLQEILNRSSEFCNDK